MKFNWLDSGGTSPRLLFRRNMGPGCEARRAQGGSGGGGGGGGGSYLCSTPSSCDAVECVFAFPTGARAIGRVGAHRFDAAGVPNPCPQLPNAAPTA